MLTTKGLIIPNVKTETEDGNKHYDIFSHLMETERKIMIYTQFNDQMAEIINAQLLYLDSVSKDDIKLYINSPGGVVTSGLSIYDTIRTIESKVSTICVGQACSMGAFLLSCGVKGKRFASKYSRVMIHQLSGGAQGQHTDIEIAYNEMTKLKETLTQVLADNCGQKYEKVLLDCERDNFMSAEEAKEYGLIDEVF